MPSADLFQACSAGDLNRVNQLVAQASPLDIEEKDQDGVTPLIAAVKNGHHDVVKALLGHGANPTHASTQGLPEQCTSDPTIVELLRSAAIPKVNPDAPHQDPRFIHDPNAGPPKAYYMPHPGPYAYYPGVPVPPLPEGAMSYYPPPLAPPTSSPPSGDDQSPPSAGSNVSNLPPPEIARLIPCRYFPACRYGASCIFAHPQGPYQGPYYQGPPPPAQYPSPYEQPPYPPNFYPPPPQFQPSNGVPPSHHLSPISPQPATQPVPPPPPPPQFVNQRNGSEIVPPLQIPFNSPGAPVPAPGPYGPMSPISPSYPHPSQHPVPLSVPPPPLVHPTGPQSSSAPFPQSAPPTVTHQRYPTSEQNGAQKPPPHEGYGQRGDRRTSGGPGFRRPSFGGGRRPPCLFFPSGRCRNGEECRFPHVMADGHVMGRGGRFRSPPQNPINGNNQANLEEKLANLSITENGNHAPRQGSSGSTTPSERGPRGANGAHVRPSKSTAAPQKQRVPNADEFPVLGGSSTPPQVNGYNSHTGPTAAQVLQAPAVRKDASKSDNSETEGQEQFQPIAGQLLPSPQTIKTASQDTTASTQVSVSALPHKLSVSFAAVANGAPDTSKEVSVSA